MQKRLRQFRQRSGQQVENRQLQRLGQCGVRRHIRHCRMQSQQAQAAEFHTPCPFAANDVKSAHRRDRSRKAPGLQRARRTGHINGPRLRPRAQQVEDVRFKRRKRRSPERQYLHVLLRPRQWRAVTKSFGLRLFKRLARHPSPCVGVRHPVRPERHTRRATAYAHRRSRLRPHPVQKITSTRTSFSNDPSRAFKDSCAPTRV